MFLILFTKYYHGFSFVIWNQNESDHFEFYKVFFLSLIYITSTS